MKTLGGFGAWNRCLNHLLTLSESHIESVILARFIEAVKRYNSVTSSVTLFLPSVLTSRFSFGSVVEFSKKKWSSLVDSVFRR